jgi:predicted  nucleic acid-binding Zn-ribbon protein
MPNQVDLKGGQLGFLSPDGKQLRTNRENQTINQQIDQATSSAPQAVESTESDTVSVSTDRSTSTALRQLKQAFLERTNETLAGLHGDRERLGTAKAVVREQVRVAKDLSVAIQAGDRDKVTELQSEFEALQAERKGISEEIDQHNDARVTERVHSIHFGATQKGVIRSKAIQFSGGKEVDTTSVRSLREFITDSSREVDALDTQLKAVDGEKDKLKGIIRDVQGEVQSLSDRSVKNAEDATAAVNRISEQISGGGLQLFEQATLTQLSADVTSGILAKLKG